MRHWRRLSSFHGDFDRSVDVTFASPASVNSRKDKSLRVMSQKFVMLFLVSHPRVVSLDVAAKILIGEEQGADQDKNKFKSECPSAALSISRVSEAGRGQKLTARYLSAAKVRRLYDIANVLRSLKLIEKVHVTEERGRKPAFEWVGPEVKGEQRLFHSDSCEGDRETRDERLHETLAPDLESSTSKSPPKRTNALELRTTVDTCAKNLFASPGTKRRFTRHPSLIKMVKSIQDDRRKINSAPSTPAKSGPGKLSPTWWVSVCDNARFTFVFSFRRRLDKHRLP